MNCFAKGLMFVFKCEGCWLGTVCLDGDVLCDCVDGGECAFCCSAVVWVGACDVLFEWLGDCYGVACPQGSKLLGDDSMASVALMCVPAGCCGDAGIGLNAEVGLSAKFGMTGVGFECKGAGIIVILLNPLHQRLVQLLQWYHIALGMGEFHHKQ